MRFLLPLSRMRRRWIGLGLCWPLGLFAQWTSDIEGLRRFRIRMSEASVELNVEAQADQRTNRGEPIRRDYVFVEPVVGLDLRGSVYHPNLFEFHVRPELGGSWQMMTLHPPGGTKALAKSLQRYNARINLLKEKPYASHLFAEQGRTYRDLDFFSRARVDQVRYGAHTGLNSGRWPIAVDAQHLSETVSGGLGRAADVAGNTFSFDVSHAEKESHKTNLSYVLNTYHRVEEGLAPTTGIVHNLNLLDAIRWGEDEWISLNSVGLYNRVNSTSSHTRNVTVLEHLGLQFRENLVGEWHYDFGDQRSDQVAGRTHEVRAVLRHQLYKSLNSAVGLHGAALDSSSRETRQTQRRVGATVEESYAKHLPARSWLSLSANWRGDRQQRDTIGQVLYLSDESLTLHDRQPAFLSQPSVLEVGRVTNRLGVAYAETLDYVLIQHGTLMEIRRVPGGNIPDGAQVLVDYTATALPTDRYSTAMQVYDVRLDLFGGLVAFYGRLNRVDNFGAKSVVLRNLADRVVGAETGWRGLTVGAERERLDSNLSPFHSERIYQTCSLDLGWRTTVTLNCDQSWTRFPDTGRTRASRSFVGRLQQQLTAFFSWQLEGGFRRERGQGIDQDRTALRAAGNFTYGKLVVNLSYEFDDENLLGELHRRRHAVLRARRTF